MSTFDPDLHNFEVAFRSAEVGGRVKAAFDAIEANNTDVQVPIDPFSGVSDDATVPWVSAITSAGVRTLTRGAGATAASVWFSLPGNVRTASGKGFKPTGVKVAWSVATATLTDVRWELWKRTIPADLSAPAAAQLIAGLTNSEYDAANNTEAERVSIASHTATVTIPTAAQSFLGTGEQYLLRGYVDGTAGATGVLALKDAALLGTENLVDLT